MAKVEKVEKAEEAEELAIIEEAAQLAVLEQHISQVEYLGDKAELVGILKGERSPYMAAQALKLLQPIRKRGADNIGTRIEDLKRKHEKNYADYQSLQIEMRKRQIQPVDRVANSLSMIAAYERVLADVTAEIEELEATASADEKSSWSYQVLTALLKAREKNEIPSAGLIQRLGVSAEYLLSLTDKLRIEVAEREKAEAQAKKEAEYAARMTENKRLEAEAKAREAEETAAVEQWDAEQLMAYAFDGKTPPDIFYHYYPAEGQQSSISEVYKRIKQELRINADSLAKGSALHYVHMRYRCFERLHEILDPADRDLYRLHMRNLASRGKKEPEPEIDTALLQAVEGWSVEELLNHVFEQGKLPEQVEIEFLAELPGCSERRSVEIILEKKAKEGDAIRRRTAARLLEIMYENGKLRSSRERELMQKVNADNARRAYGSRMN